MITVQINIPLYSNTGENLRTIHKKVGNYLADKVGGYTVWEAIGYWKAADGFEYKERLGIYQFSMEGHTTNKVKARAVTVGLANWLLTHGEQVAVYYSIDGVATIQEGVL